MKKERKFSFAGVDVKFDINMEQLISGIRDGLKERYRYKISTLLEIVKKRNEYIKNMHDVLRKKDSAMFIMLDAVHIYKKANSLYGINEKQMMILSYMCRTNMCSRIHICRYLKSIGYPKMVKKDEDVMYENGFIVPLKNDYWGITDSGRKVIDNVYNAFKQDYAYFKKNQSPVHQHEEKKTPKRRPMTKEEIEDKRRFYKTMMMPFWDINMKLMPRDKTVRIKHVNKYIDKLIENDKEVDPIYYKLLEKWSVPDNRIPRELSK